MARPPSRLRDLVSLSRLAGRLSDSEEEGDNGDASRRSSHLVPVTPMPSRTLMDNTLELVDATVVAAWLQRTKEMARGMRRFWRDGHGYEALCFLFDVDPDSYEDLVKTEVGIVRDELCLALAGAIADGHVTNSELHQLMRAILRENPKSIGPKHLGRMIVSVCLGESTQFAHGEQYRSLLSNVRCETTITEHVQWLLGARAFAVVSLCYGVMKFYLNALDGSELPKTSQSDGLESAMNAVEVTFSAASKGRYDLIEILVDGQPPLVPCDVTDSRGRKLLMAAAATGQDHILAILLNKVRLSINKPGLCQKVKCLDVLARSSKSSPFSM